MAIATNPDRWLTRRRLRAHGTILAACLWLVYAWTIATPGLRDRNSNLKGTDFLHFYTLGCLAASHRGADLYDMNAQSQLAWQRVPQATGLHYLPLYPPQVSIFFAALSYVPYGDALVLWLIFSATTYAVCCWAVWWACPHLQGYGGTVILLALAYPAFFHLIAWGQTSALALVFFTATYFFLRARQNFAAGIVLGCLIFKPQLGLAAAVVFLVAGAWKTVLAGILSAAVQLAVGIFYYGIAPLRQWLQTLANARALMPRLEPRPYQTHSLRTFWNMMIPSPSLALALYAVSAAAVLGITVALWRRSSPASLNLRYAALLFATVLVSPHLTVYDLVILAPAFLFLADWIVAQQQTSTSRSLEILLYLVYVLPLLGPLARWTHVQFSVIAMTAVVWILWRAGGIAGMALAPAEEKS